MFKNFAENIEEMVVDDVPIVKSRASRADYQTSQTTWKNRMEAQDTRWKERRDEIFEESIKSSCINKGALCSLCQNQAFVRCQTCRYHLCSNCGTTANQVEFIYIFLLYQQELIAFQLQVLWLQITT
jgi:hypothetical protein